MSKNIILLSDGTGNSSSSLFKTNVWRLFQILDLSNPLRQIAFYDDGVGTSSFKPLALLGGIFGVGLKRNVIAIYSFCCRNYAAGDKIFGFGFSRGAFTIRVVAGFIDGYIAPLQRDELDELLAADVGPPTGETLQQTHTLSSSAGAASLLVLSAPSIST